MSFDPRDHYEHEPSALSSDPDWYLRDDGDRAPVATVKAWARAMRIANAAHDAAEFAMREAA
jgi:hypothetical protein